MKRDVTRVVTPGTVFDDQTIEPGETVCLAAVSFGEGALGLALLETTTGQLRCGEVESEARLVDELRRAGARELLFPRAAPPERIRAVAAAAGAPHVLRDDAEFDRGEERLQRHLGVSTLDGFGVAGLRLGLGAAAAALAYLAETQRTPASHVDRVSRLATEGLLLVDESTRANLEIERTLQGGRRKGTLLAQLDRTATASGARLLAEWLRYPLAEVAPIQARLDAVEELFGSAVVRGDLARALRPVADVERLVTRLTLRQGNARDLRALCGALLALPALAELLAARTAPLLQGAAAGLGGLEELAAELDAAVAEEPPATLTDGGLIRVGHSPELDELIAMSEDGKDYLLRLEAGRRSAPGSARSRSATTRSSATTSRSPRPTCTPCPRTDPQADHRGRRALRHRGAEGVRGEGADRRGAARRAGAAALRGAAAAGGGASGPRLRPRREAVALVDVLRVLRRGGLGERLRAARGGRLGDAWSWWTAGTRWWRRCWPATRAASSPTTCGQLLGEPASARQDRC